MATFPAFRLRVREGDGSPDVRGVRDVVLSGITLTDGGSGTVTLTASAASPGGTPGQLQYNSSGSFAGAAALTYATSGTHLTLTPASASVNGLDVVLDPSASGYGLRVKRSSGTTGALYVDGAARVGIGTTSLTSNAAATVKSVGVAIDIALRLDVTNSGEYLLKAGGSGIISVDASGVTGGRWVVLENGNVGYGVPSPASRLDIDGTFTRSSNSSTSTKRAQCTEVPSWVDSTDATRKARVVWNVYDTAAREALRIEASGTAAMVGFYGTAAVAQQTVTGSRGGNAALADLLTKLATLGLIVDGSSA